MKLYKLTDQNNLTKNHTLWGEDITHKVAEGSGPLCSRAWLHAYEDPMLALLMNPGQANIVKPNLWEAEGEIGISDGTKVGCKKLKTIKQLPLPKLSAATFTAFGIFCAKTVYSDEKWNAWADKWLDGTDRSIGAAAEAAVRAAGAAEWAAVWAAEAAAGAAEWAAVRAAEAAEAAAGAAEAAGAAAWAAWAAAWAAEEKWQTEQLLELLRK